MGDPQKNLETETTQDVSFRHPGNPRYVTYCMHAKIHTTSVILLENVPHFPVMKENTCRNPNNQCFYDLSNISTFHWPSPVNVKERLKVNLGDFSENKWTSTMADAFREAKSGV